MKGRAGIIGAGIDGLGTALALHGSGWQVDLYQTAQPEPQHDIGLVLNPAAIAIMRAYGMGQRLEHLAVPLERFSYRKPSGEVLLELSLEDSLQRRPLAMRASILRSMLREALPVRVESVGPLAQIQLDEHRVDAQFRDGRHWSGDLLVGADGLHSQVRASFFGHSEPKYAGYMCWQGFSPRPDLIEPGVLFESSGNGHRFGAMAVDEHRVYWYACINLPANSDFGKRTREALVLRFFRFHQPIAALIESTPQEQIHCQPCYEREPLKHWSSGRVTLVGEAAHPTTPDLGQTASEAFEDGRVLARLLAEAASLDSALSHYDNQRVPSATKIQKTSHQAGRLSQLEHPLICGLRDLALRYSSHLPVQRHYRQFFGLGHQLHV